MNDQDLSTALNEENWRLIWTKAIHGLLSDHQVKVVLESDPPDWIRNVFGQVYNRDEGATNLPLKEKM